MAATVTEGERYQRLLNSLSRELFQTEMSAREHCRREAERLGDTAPADALRGVAIHAESVLQELPELAERENLPGRRAGRLAGSLFSQLRDKLADLLTDRERSYRGTLLGTRHGLDVVRMLRSVADEAERPELFAFCDAWLNTRSVLVDKIEEELQWFAKHPEAAVERAQRLPVPLTRHRARHSLS